MSGIETPCILGFFHRTRTEAERCTKHLDNLLCRAGPSGLDRDAWELAPIQLRHALHATMRLTVYWHFYDGRWIRNEEYQEMKAKRDAENEAWRKEHAKEPA